MTISDNHKWLSANHDHSDTDVHAIDIITGGDGDDVLLGQDGEDILKGEDGNDTLYGGAGTDYLDGGEGRDDENKNDNGKTTYNVAFESELLDVLLQDMQAAVTEFDPQSDLWVAYKDS
jgi:Ca2+-binding RTX toxin-like protein